LGLANKQSVNSPAFATFDRIPSISQPPLNRHADAFNSHARMARQYSRKECQLLFLFGPCRFCSTHGPRSKTLDRLRRCSSTSRPTVRDNLQQTPKFSVDATRRRHTSRPEGKRWGLVTDCWVALLCHFRPRNLWQWIPGSHNDRGPARDLQHMWQKRRNARAGAQLEARSWHYPP
jgi:hypothetical protein